MKIRKCVGCGAKLQSTDELKEGYVEDSYIDTAVICKRCFRLKHYNEYKITTRNNNEYSKILSDINNSNDLVLYVVDIFNLNYDMDMIFKYIKKNILLVITKADILPKSVKEYKIKEYFNNDSFKDTIYISSNKNYKLDKLYKMILDYKLSNNVYVVGKTNAGKSTLINQMIKNYSKIDTSITTSPLPSTTLDTIKIKLNDNITLIDTPGLIDETDIINYLDIKEIKKITPKKEIKPKTFQINGETSIIVEPYLRVDTDCNNSFTFYMSNDLVVRKNSFKNENLKSLKKHIINVSVNEDIVVNGLLWIKVIKACEVVIYTLDDVLVYTRNSII